MANHVTTCIATATPPPFSFATFANPPHAATADPIAPLVPLVPLVPLAPLALTALAAAIKPTHPLPRLVVVNRRRNH
jgi:hypothetical protein